MPVAEQGCSHPRQIDRRAKPARRSTRFKISEDRCSGASPKQICPQNQNPQNGHLMARFDWGLGAVCFGASPVAAVFGSAPGSATPPEHRIHFKPSSQQALLKQDISILPGIGHFSPENRLCRLSRENNCVSEPLEFFRVVSGELILVDLLKIVGPQILIVAATFA